MKLTILNIMCLIFATPAFAGMVGLIDQSLNQKLDSGMEAQIVSQSALENSIEVEEFVIEVRKDGADFGFEVTARVLLPVKGDSDRTTAKMKMGLNALLFNQEISQNIYNMLSVDYTAKRIAEGVELGAATYSCASAEACEMRDQVGGFDLFFFRAFGFPKHSNIFKTYVYDHGGNPYKEMGFKDPVKSSNGKLSSQFLQAVEMRAIELAPSRVIYENSESSRPSHSLTIEEHRQMAYENLANDISKNAMESQIIQSLLVNVEYSDKEGLKKSSGGSCTYFCGSSGPFVRAFIQADTNY